MNNILKNITKDLSLKFYNTRTREKEVFSPVCDDNLVRMYSCGPTVYSEAHIGNMRAYIFADLVKKVVKLAGYDVKHVMNITDVGHLTDDNELSDDGEDKMEKSARETGKTAWDIAKEYENLFFKDTGALGVERPNVVTRATEYINEQIDFIKDLENKGYIYKISDGIYFDTSKFDEYVDFAKINLEGLSGGERVDLGEKKNITDFALWKFSPVGEQRQMEWDSPWGKGFPGWHIECSAMGIKELGEQIDIHTGGIDHIPVHHTNEVAQNMCSCGHRVVNFWMHSNFLNLKEKMSKSKGNIITISGLEKKGFSAMHYRYLLMLSHYRNEVKFSFEILEEAKVSYDRLKDQVLGIASQIKSSDFSESANVYLKSILVELFDDLNTAKALVILRDILKDNFLSNFEKIEIVKVFDSVVSLDLLTESKEEEFILGDFAKVLLGNWKKAHLEKDFDRADEFRDELLNNGIQPVVKVDKETGEKIYTYSLIK